MDTLYPIAIEKWKARPSLTKYPTIFLDVNPIETLVYHSLEVSDKIREIWGTYYLLRDDYAYLSSKYVMSSAKKTLEIIGDCSQKVHTNHVLFMSYIEKLKYYECSNAEASNDEASDTKDSNAEASNAEASNAEGSDTKDSNAEASNAEASNAEASNAEASNAEASNAEASDTKDSNAEASNAEGSDTKDSNAEASDTKDSNAKGSDTKALDKAGHPNEVYLQTAIKRKLIPILQTVLSIVETIKIPRKLQNMEDTIRNRIQLILQRMHYLITLLEKL